MSDAWRDDHSAAVYLTGLLRSRRLPAFPPNGVALAPGEQLVSRTTGSFLQYTAENVSYTTSTIAFGGPVMFATSLLGSVLYNSSKLRQAERYAAPQWRHLDSGTVYFTNARLAIEGHENWLDVYYPHIRSSQLQGGGILLRFAEAPPLLLQVWRPYTHLLLLRFFAYGEIPSFGEPDQETARSTTKEPAARRAELPRRPSRVAALQ
jgi:hypothetical protein